MSRMWSWLGHVLIIGPIQDQSAAIIDDMGIRKTIFVVKSGELFAV